MKELFDEEKHMLELKLQEEEKKLKELAAQLLEERTQRQQLADRLLIRKWNKRR